jgi:hypothetical protein
MPPHFVQGAGLGDGSKVIVTMRHVEHNQLRLRIQFSRPTISSDGPRRSITFRLAFMVNGRVGGAIALHNLNAAGKVLPCP